jgi:[NiFe] hydrogenase assembly HybE family chaperone
LTNPGVAVARLVDYYRQAAGRMQGLPICNSALAVEDVGFREHDGRLVGVIVTPWFMNLTVLPASADLATWRKGDTARVEFPAGAYEFVVGDAGDNGPIATRSLFSTMRDFSGSDAAREAARAAAESLFEPGPPAAAPETRATPVFSRRKLFGG